MTRDDSEGDNPARWPEAAAPAETPQDKPIERLRAVMAALRDPETGCPWDRQQDFASIVPYTIEEAYEVAEAIAQDDMAELREELGDLLLQVVYHARMAEERGAFDFDDVANGIAEKMIRRHPHVFDVKNASHPEEVDGIWEDIKKQERADKKRGGTQPESALDDVPLALPGLTRAWKLHRKATGAGFDWPSVHALFAKIREELDELEAEIASGQKQERITEEFGDVLFTIARLGDFAGADPETAMRGAQRKFTRRFQYMEARLREQGRDMKDVPMDELERLWSAAKRAETGAD
ncbi:MAG: nucleoside triphosphate pyrophosphohydrolase [Dichotomicrobium sp.]